MDVARIPERAGAARPSSMIRMVRDTVRSSPWVVISVAAHVIVIAILGLGVHRSARTSVDEVDMSMAVKTVDPEPEALPPEPDPIRNVVPPEDPNQLVTADLPADVDPTAEPTEQPGDPDAGPPSEHPGNTGSSNIGPGGGGWRGYGHGAPGHATGPLPGSRGRVDKPVRTEKAVYAGLAWLLRHQNADGSWTARGVREHCQAEGCCPDGEVYGDEYDVGLTALALLAFLGAGQDQDSGSTLADAASGTVFQVKTNVKAGLQWLVRRQRQDGSFSPDGASMYNEALATLALCEACALARSPITRRQYRDAAQKALDFLAAAQRPRPGDPARRWGWRYASRAEVEAARAQFKTESEYAAALSDADVSVTGWVAMALKSGQAAELAVSQEAIAGALDFAKAMATDDGQSGYLKRDQAGRKLVGPNDRFTYHGGTMAAVNACIRIFLEHDAADPYLAAAADQMVKDLPQTSRDGLSVDYYYWYYATLALQQIDGPDSPMKTHRHWGPWNRAMQDAVIGMQQADAKSCRSGGWLARDRWAFGVGPVYSTALNVLTLEVYYRYPNAFGSSAR